MSIDTVSIKSNSDSVVRQYLKNNPERRKRFAAVKKTGLFITSNYDISNECNLLCEGCLFFEGDGYKNHPDVRTLDEYDTFFNSEKKRGVNFLYIAGAEPSLQQDRLLTAAKHIPTGVVLSNGTIRLKKEIPYRIHISLWGDEEITSGLRGGSVFHKPLRLFAKDPRVVFIFTISNKNIHVIPKVVEIVHSHGGKISFNHFSPTVSYTNKLALNSRNDKKYFRISSADDNLGFTDDNLQRARDTVDDLIEKYPETVVFSHAYNEIVTTEMGLYDIDPNSGIAINCAANKIDHHRHYHVDLEQDKSKCCSPNIDCKSCRAYLQSYGTIGYWFPRFLESEQMFDNWIDIMETWCRLFLVGWEKQTNV